MPLAAPERGHGTESGSQRARRARSRDQARGFPPAGDRGPERPAGRGDRGAGRRAGRDPFVPRQGARSGRPAALLAAPAAGLLRGRLCRHPRPAHLPDPRLLPGSPRDLRRPGAHRCACPNRKKREASHDGEGLPGAVPVHRQLGAQHHGRIDLEPARPGPVRGAQRGQPSDRAGAPDGARAAGAVQLPDRPAAQQKLGRVRRAGLRRRSISCSRSAIGRRARSARSGPASP